MLADAARQAENCGYYAVWSADRVVTPWDIKTSYPYSENHEFIVPPDRPFLDSLTCLAFLAGVTQKVQLGISVLVLPYRHPLYWSRVAVTIENLSKGRLIMGVGVGWMEEEFAALGVPFHFRGRMSDEQLEIVQKLWTQDRSSFGGQHYQFHDVAFYPKPITQPRIPIWVGGESEAAQRRAGRFGEAWFPYFVHTTAAELKAGFDNAARAAERAGRDPAAISLSCCRPIEVTDADVAQDELKLRGSPRQLADALSEYERIGVKHVALQFMVPNWRERKEQIERFAREVIPQLRS